MVEVIGYVASAVIVLSLTMTSLLRLRLIGLVGAALFAIYGYLVGAIPVVLTNLVIIGLHLFFLWRAWTDDEYFTLLEVRSDSYYLAQFLDFHGEDIRQLQPAFRHDAEQATFCLFILRDMVPAGLLIGRPALHGILEVELDYVTPRYRDMKAARFLFEHNRATFIDRGITNLRALGATDQHRNYLERVGFRGRSSDVFELDLSA